MNLFQRKPESLLFLGLLLTIVLFCSFSTNRGTAFDSRGGVSQQESDDVPVIGWFHLNDTMKYWVHYTKWSIMGVDTVMKGGVSTKFMLTVTDSTKTRYKFEYKILDVKYIDPPKSQTQDIMEEIVETMSSSMIGSTIKFTTNEFGSFVKVDNYNDLKNQVKEQTNNFIEIALPKLKESSPSLSLEEKDLREMMSPDVMIEGELSNIKLMFALHGSFFPIGQSNPVQENSEYESDFSLEAWTDEESGIYGVDMYESTRIPLEYLVDKISELIDMMAKNHKLDKDVIANIFSNKDIQKSAKNKQGIYYTFYPDGWPMTITSVNGLTIGPATNLKQKYIVLDRPEQ